MKKRCSKESHSRNNIDLLPKEADLKNAAHRTSQIRGKAKTASGVWDNRYIRRKLKNNPPSEYSVGGIVQHARLHPNVILLLKG